MRALLEAIARADAEVDRFTDDDGVQMASIPFGIWQDIIKSRNSLLDDEAAEIERRIAALDDERPGYVDRLRHGLVRLAPRCPTCHGTYFAMPLTDSGHNPCRDEWHYPPQDRALAQAGPNTDAPIAAAIRALPARAASEGEAVAWGVLGSDGLLCDARKEHRTIYVSRDEAERMASAANECWMDEGNCDDRDKWTARKPFRVVPLYASAAGAARGAVARAGHRPEGNRAVVEAVSTSDLLPDDVIWSDDGWYCVLDDDRSDSTQVVAAPIIDDAAGKGEPVTIYGERFLRSTLGGAS